MKNILVICVNYHSENEVEALYRSLQAQTCDDWDLVVVDNGSNPEG